MVNRVVTDNRPALNTSDWDLRDATTLVVDAIASMMSPSEPEVLRRAGALVRVERDDDGHGTVRVMGAGHVGMLIADHVRVVRMSGKRVVGTSPPGDLVRAVTALAPNDLRIPALRGIVRHPYLWRRAGGGYEMVWDEGYNPSSRWWLDCKVQLDSTLDVTAAKRAWDDLMGEFPYATAHDRLAAVAAALSPICKPAAGLVPLVVVHKPAVGTGATLICRTVGRIVTGQDPTLLTPTGGRDEDVEMRKRLFSLLRAGREMIVLDNFASLESDVLASVATAGIVEDRVMGKMEVERVEAAATMWATGNNLLTSADIASRTLPIRLDAKVPDPSARTGFRHDPITDSALKYRDHWLSALVSMVERWCEDGCPKPPKDWVRSRFSGWHDTVAAVVAFVYGPKTDPMHGRRSFIEASQTTDWGGFIARLVDKQKPYGHKWTTQDFIEVLEDMDAPPWSSRAPTEQGRRRALAYALRKIADQRFNVTGTIWQIRHIKTASGRVHYVLDDVTEGGAWEQVDAGSQEELEF